MFTKYLTLTILLFNFDLERGHGCWQENQEQHKISDFIQNDNLFNFLAFDVEQEIPGIYCLHLSIVWFLAAQGKQKSVTHHVYLLRHLIIKILFGSDLKYLTHLIGPTNAVQVNLSFLYFTYVGCINRINKKNNYFPP